MACLPFVAQMVPYLGHRMRVHDETALRLPRYGRLCAESYGERSIEFHCYTQGTIATFCIVPISLTIDFCIVCITPVVGRFRVLTAHRSLSRAAWRPASRHRSNSRKRAMVDEFVGWLAPERRTEVPSLRAQQPSNLS